MNEAMTAEYTETAAKLRKLALADYDCLEFTSICEGDQEIAISYWPSEAHIKRWKNNENHLGAQYAGKDGWYLNYTVEVVEIKRSYMKNTISYV